MDAPEQRRRLIERLQANGYIMTDRVADAMLAVHRERFVRPTARQQAYVDSPMDIGDGQTISAPHMVALMVEALRLGPGLTVLEIGAGSGYHAAVIAELVRPNGHVHAVERVAALADFARENLKMAGYGELVSVHYGDGSLGLPRFAPYDRISVACAAPDVPPPLVEQLDDGGILVVPVGSGYQELVRIERRKGGLHREDLGGCVFVPLIGQHGFEDPKASMH